MTRTLALAAAGVALLPALAGCSSGACPAVAYLYSVDVHATGEFASLEVCADGVCTASTGGGAAEAVQPPEGELPPFALERRSDGRWSVTSLQSAPDRLTLRALDSDGAVVAERGYELEWTRTGGSEQCGGPMETPALDFDATAD
ncbi:hypothetical protein [Conyzicola nivalis]